MGGSASYGRYDSQEGLDRSQEQVDFDVEATDRVLDVSGWLCVSPWSLLPVYAEFVASRQERESVLDDVNASNHLVRFAIRVGIAQ